MKKSSRQNLRKITVMAMLAAVAVVSVYFIKFPLLNTTLRMSPCL